MPFRIQSLIEGKPTPATVTPDETVQRALQIMIEGDYSQLPVIDPDRKPLGMVTSDSILRALNHFDVTIGKLHVVDTLIKVRSFRSDEDMFDLLDDLRDRYAVLIVDGEGRLTGIVTTYDTTEYFRQRAQDIMFVRDIEEMMKSYVNAAFTDTNSDIDPDAQQAAIEEITPSNKELRKSFKQALCHYLECRGVSKAEFDITCADAAFDTYLFKKSSVKSFDRLTLTDYIELLLHASRWETYSAIFQIERDAIRRLLEAVRDTRNALAHFRDEDVTSQQRDELIFCKDWLARHESDVMTAFAAGITITPEPASVGSTGVSPEVVTNERIVSAPPDEAEVSDESRYTPLITHLTEQPIEHDKVTLTFPKIEQLLGVGLPESARKHRAWWANDAVGHAHSQQWLDAGWRVANVNMAEERVIFARNKEYEQAYIEFFSALHEDLERAAPGVFHFIHSEGRYWIELSKMYAGNKNVATFYCAFTKTRRFRVELLLDAWDQARTKRLYDALAARKEHIEQEVGEPLSWERMDNKRPARIARYFPGSIKESPDFLKNLRARAVEATQRFYPVLQRHLDAILPDVFAEPRLEETP